MELFLIFYSILIGRSLITFVVIIVPKKRTNLDDDLKTIYSSKGLNAFSTQPSFHYCLGGFVQLTFANDILQNASDEIGSGIQSSFDHI